MVLAVVYPNCAVPADKVSAALVDVFKESPVIEAVLIQATCVLQAYFSALKFDAKIASPHRADVDQPVQEL